MIQVDKLVKTFNGGRTRALDGVTFSIAKGEVFGLVGPNGAGKTTLMGCLLGLQDPDSGSVSIAGKATDMMSVRARIGYMPERLDFERWMTARQFLKFHHELSGRPSSEREKEVEETLHLVALEKPAWNQQIKKYSRGMLQRTGLAQALIGKPQYLFLDEPTSGVDPTGALLIMRILQELKARGMTIVLNSHQIEHVERICDRVGFVDAGKLEALETLRQENRQPVILRRLPEDATAWKEDSLREIAHDCGCTLEQFSDLECLLIAPSEERIAVLVHRVVTAGVRLVQVSPPTRRLEHFFNRERKPEGGEGKS
jgi:ABC-2 type transport system ATP-binding protein